MVIGGTMWSLFANGNPMLTSRCISPGMMATDELYRSWSSWFFAVLAWGVSRNDINLELTHLFKHRFEEIVSSGTAAKDSKS